MFLLEEPTPTKPAVQRRRFSRIEIQCRARILIGTRQYAGYLHNISRGGAKLRTISSIRKLGSVMLRLPDLPPLRCCLRWSNPYHAGVMFELPLSTADFREWVKARTGVVQYDDEFAEVSELLD